MNKKQQQIINAEVERRVKQQLSILNSYNNYEADLGFLSLLITRHVNMAKRFVIDPLNDRLDKKDFLRDEDVKEIHNNITASIIMDISDQYKTMLITKYFKDETRLIKFIDDNILFTLQNLAIDANKNRIGKTYNDVFQKSVLNLNNINKQKEEEK